MGYQPVEDDYLFLPEDEAVKPVKSGTFEHYTDRWWTVRPGSGLVFYNRLRTSGRRDRCYWGSPQCNSDKRITKSLLEDGLYPFPAEVRFFPSVWVQISISDYQY